MSQVNTIDLNSVLTGGAELKPFFETQSEYREFRARYSKKMRPELEKQSEARRKSEQEARRRLLV